MKKLLIAASLFMVALVQGQELEAKVIEIARQDMTYYEPGATKTIKEITIQQSEENFYKDIDAERVELSEALKETSKIIDQAKKDNDQDTYRVWTFKKQRLEKFLKAQKQDVDYRIVEHKFTTRNPNDGHRPKYETRFYFFDGTNNYIGFVDGKTFVDYTVQFDKSPTQRYEAMMYKISH